MEGADMEVLMGIVMGFEMVISAHVFMTLRDILGGKMKRMKSAAIGKRKKYLEKEKAL